MQCVDNSVDNSVDKNMKNRNTTKGYKIKYSYILA